jgi:signal transduction histidine kinase
MKRWIPILIMTYILVAISWWGYLLFKKNNDYYSAMRSNTANTEQLALIEDEHKRQSNMIIGEGVVLAISVLLGIGLIYRSVSKEIQNINSQNNFLLSISHELKSPIAAIKLAIQTLLRPGLKENQKKLLMDRAVLDTDRLERMVENVLISANFDNDRFKIFNEDVDIKSLVQNIISEYGQLSDRTFEMSVDLPQPTHKTDQSAIRIILDNLLENATKYSKADTPVGVKVTDRDGVLQLSISDLGIGISDNEKSKVLERFYRSSDQDVRRQKGTGLGLYIVKRLVAELKGTLAIKDNQPSGTIVNITIPSGANG